MAARAHHGQEIPGTADPYFAHPARVAMLVSASFGCQEPVVLAAAFLHDVLEKTAVTRDEIAGALGETVADWVEWLSKNAKGEKEGYWQRLVEAPWQARLVKLADALDHLNGPPEFLSQRLTTAAKALSLASTPEPDLQRAAGVLDAAIRSFSTVKRETFPD
jgi:(p)ppGpp synthase/HD superfamily hydrolase